MSLKHAVMGALSGTSKFIGDWGWIITFTLLALYILKGYLDPKIVEWRNQMAIRDANRKERRDILDYDLKRVREQQQEAFLKTSKEHASAPTAKSAPASTAKKPSAPPSRPSYNPMGGHGGVQGYRPSKRMPPRGGGG